MSGRKSTEVVDLLERGLKARDMTNGIIDASFNRNRAMVDECARKLQSLQGTLEAGLELSEDATEMFGTAGKKQSKECAELREAIKAARIDSSGVGRLSSQLNKLDAEVAEADREAARIRQSIAHKYDYCDQEYKDAKHLKDKYNAVAQSRKNLDKEMSDLAMRSNNILQDMQAQAKSYAALRKVVADMNTTAKNRKAATALKAQLQENINNIAADWANKFYQNEFSSLSSKVNTLLGQGDEVVIQQAAAMKSEIDKFNTKLVKRIAQWEKEKSLAENACQQAEDITRTGFIDPVDYYNDGDAAKKTELFAYIKQYVASDVEDKYNAQMKQAAKAMQQENFVQAEKLYQAAGNIAVEAKEQALALQEKMIKKAELASAIENVMYDLNYGTELTIINDNPNDGFRIVCTAGDEIIDFTKIDYDADGNPVIDIDHTEPHTGACLKSMPAIAKAMRQNGIPLTDIKKNGISILGQSANATQGTRESARAH